MKLTLLFLLCLASVWSSPRVRRQVYKDINLKSVPGIMQNAAAVKAHCNCLFAPEEEWKTICDRIGRILREQFPRIVAAGRCPDECTPEEIKTTAFIVRTLRDKYGECWFKAVAHFNITTDKLKLLETFMESA